MHIRDLAEEPPKTSPDILAHTLLEAYQRYAKGNPYKPGMLVTPRRNHGIRGEGEPNLVLNVFESVGHPPLVDDGSPAYISDMRILCERNGQIISFFADSLFYEPWNGDIAIAG